MADLEQPVFDAVPVLQQLLVRGNAERQRALGGDGHGGEATAMARPSSNCRRDCLALTPLGGHRRQRGECGRAIGRRGLRRPFGARRQGQVLQDDQELRAGIDGRPELVVGQVGVGDGIVGTELHGPVAEDVVGEDVEHRRLVDRLDAVLGEQGVTPVEQVVDVLHHDRLLEGAWAQAGDGVGVERILLVGLQRGRVGEEVLQLWHRDLAELHVPPVAVGRRFVERVGARRRVEDPLVPPLRLVELEVGVEVVGDQPRDVQEQLAEVLAVRATEVEVGRALRRRPQLDLVGDREPERFLRQLLRLERQQRLDAPQAERLPEGVTNGRRQADQLALGGGRAAVLERVDQELLVTEREHGLRVAPVDDVHHVVARRVGDGRRAVRERGRDQRAGSRPVQRGLDDAVEHGLGEQLDALHAELRGSAAAIQPHHREDAEVGPAALVHKPVLEQVEGPVEPAGDHLGVLVTQEDGGTVLVRVRLAVGLGELHLRQRGVGEDLGLGEGVLGR